MSRTRSVAAPRRSLCRARRWRWRKVAGRTGSPPASTIRDAATRADIWARALAPSVTLTASARPFSGRAIWSSISRSAASGGVTSAVTTNAPAAMRRASWLTGAGSPEAVSAMLHRRAAGGNEGVVLGPQPAMPAQHLLRRLQVAGAGIGLDGLLLGDLGG